MENYFARLSQINVTEHIERKGEFAYLSWPYAVQQLRLADPTRLLGGAPLRRPALPQDRDRVLRRGRSDGAGHHPVADPPGAGRGQPADPGADLLRHQHQHPASAGQSDRPARPGALRLCRRGSARRQEVSQRRPAPKPKPSVSQLPASSRATAAQLRYHPAADPGDRATTCRRCWTTSASPRLEELTSRAASRAIKSLEKTRRAA